MLYVVPSDPFVVSFDDLPSGLVGSGTPIGAQVQRASNGTVVVGRSTASVQEVPAGSGNYVVSLTAPAEIGDYLIIVDWNGGTIESATSEVEGLSVTASMPVVPSGNGAVADAVKSHLGNTFDGLMESEHYGSTFVTLKIEAVKQRVMSSPPVTADEYLLHPLVIDYLGKLTAIELMPAAIDYWARQAQTESTGSDPTESFSYPDRLEALKQIQEELLRQTRRDEIIVVPLIDTPRTRESALVGPSIDEVDDCKVTADPRRFPQYEDFPYQRRDRVIS